MTEAHARDRDPEMTSPGELIDGGAELLSDVLRMVHVSSAIYFRGEFSAPWAFVTPAARELAMELAPGAESLVLFHVVAEGACRVALEGGTAVEARAGDVVVLPYCDVHTMGSVSAAPAVPVRELFPRPPWNQIPVVRLGDGGPRTRVLCGYLRCDDLLFNPVLRALPPLLRVRPPPGPAAAWLEASVRYTLDEAARPGPGTATLLAKLPELVLIDSLRRYVEALPERTTGWLAALRDVALGRALVAIHADPARPWTVGQLAHASAVSRSVLADRFQRVLAISPMRYLTSWRLQLAAHRLGTTDDGMAAIAASVGYESEAAFNRAFKRHVGVPPAAWRRRLRSGRTS